MAAEPWVALGCCVVADTADSAGGTTFDEIAVGCAISGELDGCVAPPFDPSSRVEAWDTLDTAASLLVDAC